MTPELVRSFCKGTKFLSLRRIEPRFFRTSFTYTKKVKCSHYRPGVAQRVGRGIDLLFQDYGTRREVSVAQSMPGS